MWTTCRFSTSALTLIPAAKLSAGSFSRVSVWVTPTSRGATVARPMLAVVENASSNCSSWAVTASSFVIWSITQVLT